MYTIAIALKGDYGCPMKNKSTKTRLLALIIIVIGFIVLGRFLLIHCPTPPDQGEGGPPMHIDYLYPWPNAKILFTCQTWAFLISPFGPDMTYVDEAVFKEDGYPILEDQYRKGVIVARIAYIEGNYQSFPDKIEDIRPEIMPAFAKAVSIYVDGKKLEIGHIGHRGFDNQFIFATILNPFLWPGEHIGKIVILLPSGETTEYEWHFEVTWW